MANSLALICPHCERRAVSVAKKIWFLHGFIFFASYGSKRVIGCRGCVDKRVAINLLVCLLVGWWCFPWGLGTPLVVLQNLVFLALPNRALHRALDETLALAGTARSEVEVGDDGLTVGQRRMVDVLVAALAETLWADGHADDAEVALASALVTGSTGGRVDAASATTRLRSSIPPVQHSARLLEEDFRFEVFVMAAKVAKVDDLVTEDELKMLFSLADRLGIEASFAEAALRQLFADATTAEWPLADSNVARALEILGVCQDTPLVEVKQRYRTLMLRHHPDLAGTDPNQQQAAHDRAKEINWAYELLTAKLRVAS